MSRSIHTTRRDVDEADSFDYADEDARKRAVEDLIDHVRTKRRVKWRVKQERQSAIGSPVPTSVETIPISTEASGPYVHYPASADDLRGLLRELPAGVADGLESIELSLGMDVQREAEEDDPAGLEPDPYVGRISDEIMPGVFAGRMRGQYTPWSHHIAVFGYVYAPELPERDNIELFLRLQMLSIFAHEAAHHFDCMSRVARGRWRADDTTKVEVYAEHMQHQWLSQHVVPYLNRHHRDSVAEMSGWLRQHAGADVPLSLLAGDPRGTAKRGQIHISALFDTSHAFHSFVENLRDGTPAASRKLEFARDLHYAEEYDVPLKIVENMLAAEPEDLEAITLHADIREHLREYERALQLAEQVLTKDPDYLDALTVVADVCQAKEDWQGLLVTAERMMRLSTDSDRWTYARALAQRGTARLELGDTEGVAADIAELRSFDRPSVTRRADRLQAALNERTDGESSHQR